MLFQGVAIRTPHPAMKLIDHDGLTELTRETLEWSLKLCPQRSEQEHLDYAFAAVAALLGDTP
jgi:hypothetical protein